MNKAYNKIQIPLDMSGGKKLSFEFTSKIENRLRAAEQAYRNVPAYNSQISYRNNMIKTAISDISIDSQIDTSIIESLAVIMSGKIKNKNQQSALNMLSILDTGLLDKQANLTHDYLIEIWRNLTSNNRNIQSSLSFGYRKTKVEVIRVKPGSLSREVLHTAPKAKIVPQLMENLLLFYNTTVLTNNIFYNAVLKSMIFSAYFVYVHPFLDGNGRTSRLLGNKCLVDHGLDKFRYISFTAEMVKQKKEYSSIIRDIENNNDGDITEYVEFMCGLLQTLLDRISNRELNGPDVSMLSSRQKLMLNIIRGSSEGMHVKLYKNMWNTIAKENGYKTITIKEADLDITTLLLEDLIIIDERYVRYPGFKYYKS